MISPLSDAELSAYLRATRPVNDLSDDELVAELRRALGPLPDPATIADLRRVREQATAAYRAAYGRGTGQRPEVAP